MNKKSEQFGRGVKSIKLSPEEKSAARQSILNFIVRNPVSHPISVRPNFWSNIFLTKLSLSSTMAILLLLSVIVSGGVAVGAENALPGDILYPVKIGVNEEVRGWLIVSEQSKADWEVRRVERRLEEAEELTADSSLNIENREKIEANFEAHADRVKKRIEKFEGKENFKSAVDISSKFEASLKAHQEILNKLSGEAREDVKKEVKPIQVRVKSKADNFSETRKRIQIKADGEVNLNIEYKESNDQKDSEEADSNDDNVDNNLEVNGNARVNVKGEDVKGEADLRSIIGF
jgi:hypothetical protein